MTSTPGHVLDTRHGQVRLLTLNRPAALNAFDQRLYDGLADALIRAEADADVSVIVLTGAGRAFSAGTDLDDLVAHGDFRRGPDTRYGFEGLLEVLLGMQKPFVCAVNGLAVGLGATADADSTRRAIERESAAFDQLLGTPAHRDALRAFHDRRSPGPALPTTSSLPA